MITFEDPEYSVNEGNGTVEVCLLIIEGVLEREVVVTLSTSDGSAVGEWME